MGARWRTPIGGGQGVTPVFLLLLRLVLPILYYRLHLFLAKIGVVLTGRPSGGSIMTLILLMVSLSSQAVILLLLSFLVAPIQPSNSLMPAFSSPSQPTP